MDEISEQEEMRKVWTCGVCSVEVQEQEDALSCDLCKTWFHRDCMRYNKSTYKAIQQCSEVKWFCKSCGPKTEETMKVMNSVLTRMEGLERKNAELEKRMIRMENNEDKLRDRIEDLEKTNFDIGKFTDVANVSTVDVSGLQTQSTNKINEKNDKTIDERIQNGIQELKENESRKKNIIVTNIPEFDTHVEDDKRRLFSMIGLAPDTGKNETSIIKKMMNDLNIESVAFEEIYRIPLQLLYVLG